MHKNISGSEHQHAQDVEPHEELLSQSETLLTQAMSAFQLQSVNTVAPSFPCLISGTKKNDDSDFAVDVSQTFLQQEAIFQNLENTKFKGELEEQSNREQGTEISGDPTQIDAIRSMFDK